MKFTTRLAVMFGIFLVAFSMLGMRLWFIQIAEGAEAAEEAQGQSWVYVETPAPRGDIRDRQGVLLATSRFVPAVVVDRHLVPPDRSEELIQRLSSLLAIPPDAINAQYQTAGVNGRFTVALIDVAQAYQINEQLRDLPGVRIEKLPQRVYLGGETMAHVLGHLGLPTVGDLEQDPDLDPNNRIGQLGVESIYDQYLQGSPGELAFQVKLSEVTESRPELAPASGSTVFLTLDSALQTVLEDGLRSGIENANDLKDQLRAQGETENTQNPVVRAAGVVLDVKTGAVLAMASIPSFDPNQFVSGLDATSYQILADQKAFLNLAVSGQYPPASTFKAVTYLTLLDQNIPFPEGVEGVDPANRIVHCDGELVLSTLTDGSRQDFSDWYQGDLGWLDYHGALEKSCNIFFYNVALGVWQAWKDTPRENVIQDQARELGFGAVTGIDLTGEAAGIIPDRELFEGWKQLMLENEDAPRLLEASRLETASPWFGGDLMNTAIGQGSVVATPLQVAVAYAAMANGGNVWSPYVVDRIEDQQGVTLYSGQSELIRDAALNPAHVQSLLTDLNRVVTTGTARGAFAGFGDSLDLIGGKTGTGQTVESNDNHAWFVGVAPIDNPRYVVVILIDEGGSGGAVAAPVGRYVLQHLMGEELDPIQAGEVAD